MHELSIAQSMLKIIEDEMTKHSLTKVTKVKIIYGQISALVPEALETAFEVLTANTIFKDTAIELEMKPLVVRCGQCQQEFKPQADELVFMICPQCTANSGHEIISGRELYIDHLEAENPQTGDHK